MGEFRGLFVGLTTIDIQYFVDEFPCANIKTKSSAPEILVGGPAANAAVTFAQLNGDAALISAVGENSFAGFIQNDFESENVALTDLKQGEDFSPILATVVTSTKNGDRNIFTHHPEVIETNFLPEELFEKYQPQIILFDGFYPEFAIPFARLAKQQNIPVVLDCGSWKNQYDELFESADFVICSENFYPQNTVNSQHVKNYLGEKNVPNFAITRGGKSILFPKNRDMEKYK